MEKYVKTNKAKDLLEKMESAVKYGFKDLTLSKIPANISGVYVISQSSDDKVLYVGRTVDLQRRICTNHLHGNTSTARLKKYLLDDGTVSDLGEAKLWIKNNCYFQYIELSDSAERGKAEGLYSFFLDVKYIQKEH